MESSAKRVYILRCRTAGVLRGNSRVSRFSGALEPGIPDSERLSATRNPLHKGEDRAPGCIGLQRGSR